jgi:hypothetical protein
VTVPHRAGHPDGLVVDAEGGIWLALWAGGAIHRYMPDGKLDRTIPLPVTHPTKCARTPRSSRHTWARPSPTVGEAQPQASRAASFHAGLVSKVSRRVSSPADLDGAGLCAGRRPAKPGVRDRRKSTPAPIA